MKLDLGMKLLDPDGKERQQTEIQRPFDSSTSTGPLLLSHALHGAVNASYRGEEGIPNEEIYSRGRLAKRVRDKGMKNFSSEEIQLLLKCVAKRYLHDPEFVVYLSHILDPDNEKFKDTEPPAPGTTH